MADLSGMWLGTYWQQGTPTRFEMTLVQGGNTLSGRVLDDNHLGESSLTGEVLGRSITFTKCYLTSSRHTVAYAGTVAEDANSMQGQWQVGISDSGAWEAHRSDDNLSLSLETRIAETVPASV